MSASIEEFRHLDCPAPERCSCSCDGCKRAWFAAGRPLREDGPSVHPALEVGSGSERRARAAA